MYCFLWCGKVRCIKCTQGHFGMQFCTPLTSLIHKYLVRFRHKKWTVNINVGINNYYMEELLSLHLNVYQHNPRCVSSEVRTIIINRGSFCNMWIRLQLKYACLKMHVWQCLKSESIVQTSLVCFIKLVAGDIAAWGNLVTYQGFARVCLWPTWHWIMRVEPGLGRELRQDI